MSDEKAIHPGSKLDPATLDLIADLICGDDAEQYPKYRSSQWLTRFFQDSGVTAVHQGESRKKWTFSILDQLTPSEIERVILRLADLKEYKGKFDLLKKAIKELNVALSLDGYKIGFVNNRAVIQFADPLKLDDDIIGEPDNVDEKDFLDKQFVDKIKINELNLDTVLTEYLQDRVNEAQSCPSGKVPLGTIFLLGSTLEGLLMAVAMKNQAQFMSAKAAPKAKDGKPYKVYDWKLSNLIDVCYELNYLKLDVKKFSHVLRDFRNYIHPYHQMAQSFKPDQHTVDICWQVFKAAYFELKATVI